MTLKINPIVATIIIAVALILLFALFKGCKQNKIEVAAKEKAEHIADSALKIVKEFKTQSDSSARSFQDTIEFERGQKELITNQKAATEADLDRALADNQVLIGKHNLADYTDTSTIIVPSEYVMDCENCFTRLDSTTKIAYKYKNDFNKLQGKWEGLNTINENRFKQLEAEKLGFYNKINSLTKQQKDAVDKLQPHGRLYLSWGVLWSPWPMAAGAGLMYQTRYNFQYGAKVYYGNHGTMVETSMHFPLSIKL